MKEFDFIPGKKGMGFWVQGRRCFSGGTRGEESEVWLLHVWAGQARTTECQGGSTGHGSSHVHEVSATGIDCESVWVRACEHAESVNCIFAC